MSFLKSFVGDIIEVRDAYDSGWCRARVRAKDSGIEEWCAGVMPDIREGQRVELKYTLDERYHSMKVGSYRILGEAPKPEPDITLEGTVMSVIYKSDSGFCVYLVAPSDLRTDEIKVTGKNLSLVSNMAYSFDGHFEDNQKYGRSFRAKSATVKIPEENDIQGIYEFLSSGLIDGIGETLAERIVLHFGSETLNVIRSNDPKTLQEVEGVGAKKAALIMESINKFITVQPVVSWCRRHGITTNLAMKVFDEYGEDALKTLKKNPYVLSDSIRGVGFRKCDEIALASGIPADSPIRIRAGIQYCLEQDSDFGNTWMEFDTLVKTAADGKYLGIDKKLVSDEILKAPRACGVFIESEGDRKCVFHQRFYYAEYGIANSIHRISKDPTLYRQSPRPVDFGLVERKTNFAFTEEQKRAISTCFNSRFSVITGGPGVGKTASMNGLIRAYEMDGKRVALAAPTGKAAARLAEMTERDAKTIHRLLGYNPDDGFTVDAQNPLKTDVVIVDEVSMVDVVLMQHLLDAVQTGTSVVLVGDINQLPAVGAGNVLRDIIDSGYVPVSRLTKVFRQRGDSDIIGNAYKINAGVMPCLSNPEGSFFHFLGEDDAEKIADYIVQFVTEEMVSNGFDPSRVQVLSPKKKSTDPLGSFELNKRIQAGLNPDGKVVAERGGFKFKIGDRVIQTKNNYDKEVFNGDTGIVLDGFDGRGADGAVMEVDFGDHRVRYSQVELNQVELAYALTVHKSQGSEYPWVIMPVHNSHLWLLDRALLYTAVTRAKDRCVLMGQEGAVANAVQNSRMVVRNTYLKERMREVFGQKARNTLRQKGPKVGF